MSPERLQQSLHFLKLFRVGVVDVETAMRYARIVAMLRGTGGLTGRSKPDLWIAAWALQHGARLATRNERHFRGIEGLGLVAY